MVVKGCVRAVLRKGWMGLQPVESNKQEVGVCSPLDELEFHTMENTIPHTCFFSYSSVPVGCFPSFSLHGYCQTYIGGYFY